MALQGTAACQSPADGICTLPRSHLLRPKGCAPILSCALNIRLFAVSSERPEVHPVSQCHCCLGADRYMRSNARSRWHNAPPAAPAASAPASSLCIVGSWPAPLTPGALEAIFLGGKHWPCTPGRYHMHESCCKRRVQRSTWRYSAGVRPSDCTASNSGLSSKSSSSSAT